MKKSRTLYLFTWNLEGRRLSSYLPPPTPTHNHALIPISILFNYNHNIIVAIIVVIIGGGGGGGGGVVISLSSSSSSSSSSCVYFFMVGKVRTSQVKVSNSQYHQYSSISKAIKATINRPITIISKAIFPKFQPCQSNIHHFRTIIPSAPSNSGLSSSTKTST